MKKPIRGSGGGGKSGGGGARSPVEAVDSLRSRQEARVLDIVSEGEVVGLVDGFKSVFLNDTPVQNADGSYNFSGATIQTRNGTQSQSYIPGFDAVESETAVSVAVTQASPVVRTISNANADAVRVTLSVPQLSYQDPTNGDLSGTSVVIAIDVQNDGGGYVPQAIGKAFTTSALATTASSATSVVASSSFEFTLSWTPDREGYGYQTCTMQLQYRLIGNPAWNVSQNYVFSTLGFAFDYLGSGHSYSKTLSISLPEARYEFRIVKIDGSDQPYQYSEASFGIEFGGSVGLTYAAAYQPSFTDFISGKTTSRYQRAYRVELVGDGPWDVRVRRITADSTQVNLQNGTIWDSFTEIIDVKLTYPNTALVALSIDAENFQNIPTRGYDMKGIKVKIPSNYDPVLRTYTGAWNGSFVVDWTDNPAWCFYDLLTNSRYGLGAFINVSQVDKWALYQIAQYCDEMLDDGYGSIEPRFTCNIYLQTREEAYNVIASFASIFCSQAFWAGGSIVTTQDAPSEPVALFTPANVIEVNPGQPFNYSGSSLKARHTVALVTWNDPSDRFRQKVEYVADEDGIKKYGVIQTEVIALGCTSRGQAHRYGRRILYTERMETEIINFRTGLDGLAVMPGEIIQTSDPVRAGERLGGRIISATATEIVLDSEVTIVDANTYNLWATLPDGTVESRLVVTGAGVTNTLQLSTALTSAPQELAMWVLAAVDLVPETWRVIGIAEVDGTQAEITALAYRHDKYAAIEQGLKLEPLKTSNLNGMPDIPVDLVISESLYLVTSVVVGVRLTLSWFGTAAYFELQYRRNNSNWTYLTTRNSSVDIQPAEPGVYEFRLVAVNSIGRRSLPRNVTQEVVGKLAPPVDVENFTVIKSSGVAVATWLQHPDLDVRIGGRVVIRHSPWIVDVDWNDGYILEEFGGDVSTGVLPLITGTYFAKARDSSDNWSDNAVSFIATEGMVTGFTTVGTSIQAPLFDGVHTNVAVVSGALQLDGAVLVDDITDLIDSWSVIDALGGTAASGSYLFDAVMDLGSVATRRFEADIVARSFDTGDLIDSRLMLIDGWDAFDGGVINDCDVTLYAETTDDDPDDDPVWSLPTPYFVSDFTCRAIRHRLDFISGQGTHNIAVSELTVHAKVPA